MAIVRNLLGHFDSWRCLLTIIIVLDKKPTRRLCSHSAVESKTNQKKLHTFVFRFRVSAVSISFCTRQINSRVRSYFLDERTCNVIERRLIFLWSRIVARAVYTFNCIHKTITNGTRTFCPFTTHRTNSFYTIISNRAGLHFFYLKIVRIYTYKEGTRINAR